MLKAFLVSRFINEYHFIQAFIFVPQVRRKYFGLCLILSAVVIPFIVAWENTLFITFMYYV